jgi:hypothetical protein
MSNVLEDVRCSRSRYKLGLKQDQNSSKENRWTKPPPAISIARHSLQLFAKKAEPFCIMKACVSFNSLCKLDDDGFSLESGDVKALVETRKETAYRGSGKWPRKYIHLALCTCL